MMRYSPTMTRTNPSANATDVSRSPFRTTSVTLVGLVAALPLLLAVACGPKKPAETEGEEASPTPAPSASGTAKAEGDGSDAPTKKECVGFEIDLANELSKAACEVERKDEKALDPKGVLEVKLTANPPKVAPGGRVDVIVTFANKKKGGGLPLSFTVAPFPKFEIEVYDTKGRRVDAPGTMPPVPGPQTAEEKVARVTIAENGKGFVALGWDAVKTRWAPEKVKGAAIGSSYPRVPTGPLPKGKYKLKVVTPLLGISEGIDHEISSPTVDIEIGK